MNRCRRTDAIADIVADPALGADALTEEQRRHVSVCADCFQVVADLERLDAALTAGLRSRPREELPISVLATPALPRSAREGPSPMAFLAAAAVVVLAVGLTVAGARWLDLRQIGIGPNDPSPSAQPTQAPPSWAAPSIAAAPSSTQAPSATPIPEPVSLEVGAIAAVVDEPLVVRVAPGTDPDTTMTDERLWIGQRVRILDGPARSDGYTWWEVEVGEIRGWVADAERDGSKPWLSPIENGQIMFWRHPSESVGATTLFTINADGSGERAIGSPIAADFRLVMTCAQGATSARWAPNGTWAAFDITASGCNREVFAVSGDGFTFKKLGDGWGPTWRPDSAAVAFAPNHPSELMIAGLDGAPATALTGSEPNLAAALPAWSPDRRSLAFEGFIAAVDDPGERSYSIYVAAADGTGARPIAQGHRPMWSPDGRWILFEVSDANGAVELHRIRPDGSDEAVVGAGGMAQFSPDGSALAVVQDDGIWLMAPDGTNPSPAIRATVVFGFDWAPDGSGLVAASDHEGTDIGITVVSLDGQAPTISELVDRGEMPSWQPVLLDPRLAD